MALWVPWTIKRTQTGIASEVPPRPLVHFCLPSCTEIFSSLHGLLSSPFPKPSNNSRVSFAFQMASYPLPDSVEVSDIPRNRILSLVGLRKGKLFLWNQCRDKSPVRGPICPGKPSSHTRNFILPCCRLNWLCVTTSLQRYQPSNHYVVFATSGAQGLMLRYQWGSHWLAFAADRCFTLAL